MLIEPWALTEAQLQTALSGQKKSGLKLGQYLVQSGLLKESVIIDSVSKQLRIERYTPDKHPYEDRIDTLLPEELAQKHRLAPLSRRGHLLLIAMTDPMDINALDTVEIATNLERAGQQLVKRFELLFSAIYGRGEAGKDLSYGMPRTTPTSPPRWAGGKGSIAIDALQDHASQARSYRMVNSILGQAEREHASDVHNQPGKRQQTAALPRGRQAAHDPRPAQASSSPWSRASRSWPHCISVSRFSRTALTFVHPAQGSTCARPPCPRCTAKHRAAPAGAQRPRRSSANWASPPYRARLNPPRPSLTGSLWLRPHGQRKKHTSTRS